MFRTFLMALLLSFLAARGSAREVPRAPENILEHFAWCGQTKNSALSLARYEGFWQRHQTDKPEYEDAIHIRLVHLCAYRLAALYAARGEARKCRKMLDWLQARDPMVQ